MKGSMSRKGNSYDNACIESFHSIIKRESSHRRNDRTRKEASKEIFEYVQTGHNRARIHSSIGYRVSDAGENDEGLSHTAAVTGELSSQPVEVRPPALTGGSEDRQ
jgi:transposase InsO family protein